VAEPAQPEQRQARRPSLRLLWGLLALVVIAGLFLVPGGMKETYEVSGEFTLHPLVKLPSIGRVDLSVNKAVIYLWLTMAIVVIMGLVIARILRAQPGRFQYAMEFLYGLAHDGITSSVMKSGAETWFPYVGSVFFFVLICNLIGLVPMPVGEFHQFQFYTATANLYVTVTLALMTFVFTQYAGIHKKGLRHYVAGWVPAGAPPVLREFIFVIHAISEIFRVVSLSVRLFANMLAGHAIFAVFFAMALIFQNYLAAAALQAGSVVIWLFEVFVAVIQAFIFAILSAVYIGGALEEEH
jgi:F-type H+-transporting ATPase subunit a